MDSSVGGKTGVNHPGGKNLIGAFHQPQRVFADTDTLATLPDRELRAGLAEVIKYGAHRRCAPSSTGSRQNIETLLARDTAALAHAIARSCEIKAEIVGRDEREQGERALLNFGHTFGHAIESATGYAQWLHGEAVGAGMLMAADMSQRLGWVSAADVRARRALLRALGLPRGRAPRCRRDTLAEKMKIDKKVSRGRIRLVLLQGHRQLRASPATTPTRRCARPCALRCG